MAIAIRGTSSASTTDDDFTIAPPSGTQPGDLLVLIRTDQANPPPTTLTGWTNFSAPTNFPNGDSLVCRYRYADDPVATNYTLIGNPTDDSTAAIIALYSDTGGTLTVDEVSVVLTESEPVEISNVTYNLQSVTTLSDDSLLVGVLGAMEPDEVPGTPSGTTSQMTYSPSGLESGGVRIVTQAIASAGATGSKFIATIDTVNSFAGAMAVGETEVFQAAGGVTASATMTGAASGTVQASGGVSATATMTAAATVTTPTATHVAETAMGDYALTWGDGSADLTLVDDDLKSDQGMRTAILLSLFTDRRANPDDEIPADDGDRRGWWADEFAEVQGDLFGSRNWLLDRAKLTPDTVAKAKEYDDEALAWMVEDAAVERVVNTPRIERGVLWHLVEVFRPDGSSSNFKFAHVWTAEEAAV